VSKPKIPSTAPYQLVRDWDPSIGQAPPWARYWLVPRHGVATTSLRPVSAPRSVRAGVYLTARPRPDIHDQVHVVAISRWRPTTEEIERWPGAYLAITAQQWWLRNGPHTTGLVFASTVERVL
jgi:hypothetical protein